MSKGLVALRASLDPSLDGKFGRLIGVDLEWRASMAGRGVMARTQIRDCEEI
jgi:hypothetical protein